MGETSKLGEKTGGRAERSGARSASGRGVTASGTSPSGTYAESELPRMLTDRYRLEAMIAKGGMGRVYRATQLPLERSVAVKVLVPPPNVDGDFHRRFLLEASVCANLTHPNIVVVHDYGESEEGELFMAMELLDGEPLRDTIEREGPLEPDRAARIAVQIARALRAAHREGVAHRDLKPGNVFVRADSGDEDGERDVVKVLDFGLVKVFEEERAGVEEDETDGDLMLGSPRYMSPEQVLCEAVDARSDIYSFGACLFAMLTGRPPFLGRSPMEVLTQHLRRPTPSLASVFAELPEPPAHDPPEALDAVIQRCMQKDPDERYQSIDEVIDALKAAAPKDAALTGAFEALGSTSEIRPTEARASSSRLPWLLAAALLGLAGLAAAMILPRSGAEGEPPAPRVASARPAAPLDVPVTITSEPSGAEVSSGGVVLGVTPLTRDLPVTPHGATREFELRLEGYLPGRARHEVVGEFVEVHVGLEPAPPPEPPQVEEAEPTPPVRRAAPRRRRAAPRAARREETSPRGTPQRSRLVDERRTRIPVVD